MAAHLTFLALVACGGPATAVPHPLDYLAAGVTPRAEADTATHALEEAGWTVELRVDADTWTALGLRAADDRRSVRVFTARGVALALDSHESDGVRPRHGPVALVEHPRADFDLDRDGTQEIVVARVEAGRACLGLFRVGDDGSVAPLPWDPGELPTDACVERLRDVDGDGRIEPIAVLRADALARDATPTIEVPLERTGAGTYRGAAPPVRWVAEQRARLDAELAAAVRGPDADVAYRIAVERAALERAIGHDAAMQLAAFDDVMGRVVLDAALAEDVAYARAFVAAGWRAP